MAKDCAAASAAMRTLARVGPIGPTSFCPGTFQPDVVNTYAHTVSPTSVALLSRPHALFPARTAPLGFLSLGAFFFFFFSGCVRNT